MICRLLLLASFSRSLCDISVSCDFSISFDMASANQERTFIMIKPDGVQRGLVGEIIRRFEAKGFKLVALKMKQVGVCRCRSA